MHAFALVNQEGEYCRFDSTHAMVVAAGIMTPVSKIHLQPDPIFPGAERAGHYRVPEFLRQFTRSHAIVTFSEPVFGPVVIEAGRYVGLGLMAGLNEQE